nr:uncharacterized protein LOC112020721 [Quercus suber]
MESSVQRRVEAISRHLLSLPREPSFFLHQVLLNGGKVKNGDAEAVIIGGMVLDIHAIPSVPANPRTTTPGKVRYVLGGVARNVAECVSKLGAKPFMISAVGLDMAGKLLLEHWKSAGLSTEGIRKQQDIGTPVVCNILDINGELAAAVASVEAIKTVEVMNIFHLLGSYLTSRFLFYLPINVKYLGNEFYGDTAIVFPSLESLELCDMTYFEEWRTVNGKESFPHLIILLIA